MRLILLHKLIQISLRPLMLYILMFGQQEPSQQNTRNYAASRYQWLFVASPVLPIILGCV
jgi:hypothetical protein